MLEALFFLFLGALIGVIFTALLYRRQLRKQQKEVLFGRRRTTYWLNKAIEIDQEKLKAQDVIERLTAQLNEAKPKRAANGRFIKASR